MNDIDEGTIHAWLDGAVDATQSREIESHVAQCATCSAAVAEARGLVAGASRILNALDDVPAGVTPKRASAPRRQWRAAPWVTGIAAALMLGIGVSQWNRDGLRRAAEKDTLVKPEPVTALAAPAESVPPESVPPTSTAPPPASVRPSGPQQRARARQLASADVALRRDTARRETARVFADTTRSIGSVASPTAGAAQGAAVTATPSALPTPAPSEASAKRVVGRSALADAPTVQLRGVVAASALEEQPIDKSILSRLAGCYYTGATPPIVRLDTARSAPGYLVRAEASGSSIGWWHRIDDALIRVNLSAGATLNLGQKNRATCPEKR